MAKRGGFPGGMPGNMNNLMKQAQRGANMLLNGAVEVVVTGKKEVVKVTLSEEAVDPDDIETLQDMIMAAANEALRQAEEANSELMGKMTGGLGGLGGGLPF